MYEVVETEQVDDHQVEVVAVPSESRIAISLRRELALASSRFATFEQAISSTRPTITISSAPPWTRIARTPGKMLAGPVAQPGLPASGGVEPRRTHPGR